MERKSRARYLLETTRERRCEDTGGSICSRTWVEVTLTLVVPLFALFDLGRCDFGKNGFVVGQEGGTSQI